MQCHLEPTSTGIPSLIRKFNRGPFSFVPGEPLSDFVLAFDLARGTGHDDKFEIVGSSAYRLRQSQCFLKSNGAMTCLTCHDPHEPAGTTHVADYNRRCLSCHPKSAAKPANCVDCHMPRVSPQSPLRFSNHWIGIYRGGSKLKPAR